MGKPERAILTALFAVLLALRFVYAFHQQVDSDEPQHMHVVWGWAHGLLQYRDIFDNHAPLFQMLCAPVFRLFGERADIVLLMRLVMIPLNLFVLWCVFKIGEALFSRRAGAWAAVFAGFVPVFFYVSTEFRTDDLWVAFWMASLLVMLRGKMDARRGFVFGLLLGATFSVSMKTSLLCVALGLAGAAVLAGRAIGGGGVGWRRFFAVAPAALAGVVIIPGALVAFFAAHHALGDMFYCVIRHNTTAGIGNWHRFSFRTLCFPVAVPVLLFAARHFFLRHGCGGVQARRAVVLLTAGFYSAALYSYWPLITNQDYMPPVPLWAVVLAPAVLALQGWLAAPPRKFAVAAALPGAVAVCELALLVKGVSPFRHNAAPHVKMVETVLRLTSPDEFVMDGKGETIFRNRPFRYVLEGITRARLSRGLLHDNIVERLIETRTCVVRSNRLPVKARDFVEHNYLPVYEAVRVAGMMLEPPGGGAVSFDVKIPASYVIISPSGNVAGSLDGRPLSGAVFLDAGRHEFVPAGREKRLALIWSRAVERGFSPFDDSEKKGT